MTETMVWLIILLAMLIMEVATMGLATIWFAGGALVATILAALGVMLPVQIIVFLLVSIILLFFTRPIALKYFNKERTKTNVDSLTGKHAIVVEEVDNLKNKGKATLNGMEWSVKAVEDGMVIPEGAVVTIAAVSGVKLIVEERKGEE